MFYITFQRDPVITPQGDIHETILGFIRTRLGFFWGSAWTEVENREAMPDGSGVLVTISSKTPLIDEAALLSMVEASQKKQAAVSLTGACPGTIPIKVEWIERREPEKKASIFLTSSRHALYNCQLSLSKQKRLWIFLRLLEKFPDLAKWPIKRILDYLSSQDGTAFVISYGETCELERYTKCPNCQSEILNQLSCSTGQPVIGFLTRQSLYYSECGECRLVFLNPHPRPQDLYKLYDWYDLELSQFDTKKLTPQALYLSSPYRQHHVALFEYLESQENKTLDCFLDVGGGSGTFALAIRDRYTDSSITLIDFRIPAVEFLCGQGINARESDIFGCNFPPSSFDVITLWEVVEHLSFGHLTQFLKLALNWLRPGGRLVFSTPDMHSPLCRSLDFWAWFAPHHLTVLNTELVKNLAAKTGFEFETKLTESVVFGPGRSDFAYASETHSSMASRSEALLLRTLLESPYAAQLKGHLQERGWGSELIAVLRRPI